GAGGCGGGVGSGWLTEPACAFPGTAGASPALLFFRAPERRRDGGGPRTSTPVEVRLLRNLHHNSPIHHPGHRLAAVLQLAEQELVGERLADRLVDHTS